MNILHVKNVSHWFGSNRVLHEVNLQITGGQIVALVGPSGCGKSTLLRAILGTHPPCDGEIFTHGKRITSPCRDVGIVYQNYDLYDFLTVEQNVAVGLRWDTTTFFDRIFKFWKWRPLRKQQLEVARRLLDKVGLGAKAKLYPHELSGGQRQRVAICQSVIMKPKILLLDEPFGALDEATREELQLMLLHFYQENIDAKDIGKKPPYTILIVTHELNEALYVSDRVIGLSQYHDGNLKDGRFENKVGATIVYDKAAPIFKPDDEKDYSMFVAQREELRNKVFDEDHCQHHHECVTFWDDR